MSLYLWFSLMMVCYIYSIDLLNTTCMPYPFYFSLWLFTSIIICTSMSRTNILCQITIFFTPFPISPIITYTQTHTTHIPAHSFTHFSFISLPFLSAVKKSQHYHKILLIFTSNILSLQFFLSSHSFFYDFSFHIWYCSTHLPAHPFVRLASTYLHLSLLHHCLTSTTQRSSSPSTSWNQPLPSCTLPDLLSSYNIHISLIFLPFHIFT